MSHYRQAERLSGMSVPRNQSAERREIQDQLRRYLRSDHQHHIVLLIVSADLIAGTAYIIGFLLEQHFMLVLGVAHVALGALHYVEHKIEANTRETAAIHGTMGFQRDDGSIPRRRNDDRESRSESIGASGRDRQPISADSAQEPENQVDEGSTDSEDLE